MGRKKTYYIDDQGRKVYYKICKHCGRDYTGTVRSLYKLSEYCGYSCRQKAYNARNKSE